MPWDPSLAYPTTDQSIPWTTNGVNIIVNGQMSWFYIWLTAVELHLFYIEVSEETVWMFKAKCAEEEKRTGTTHGMSFMTKWIMTVQRPFTAGSFIWDLP